MQYLNQLGYPHIAYMHGTSTGGVPKKYRNVGTSGCGLCSACMMVDRLTDQILTIEEAVKLSEDNGANIIAGTRMCILGPVLAEKYNLTFAMTKSTAELVDCLQRGGAAIINVGGNHDDYVGVFSKGGHYIFGLSTDGENICILDPSWSSSKMHTPEREGKVLEDPPFLYCSLKTLEEDTQNRETPFYLFMRKKPE